MIQPRLFEFRMGERSPDTLVVTEANRDAARLLTSWTSWPGGALALVGPQGSGKTHLALAWAVEVGARQVPATADPETGAAIFADAGGRVLIDDADAGPRNEAMLWRVLDLARAASGSVLLVAKERPAGWAVGSPDLASRLSALPLARLGEPDEALLELVLRRKCREQFILLSDDAAEYLVRRMPRTFAAAGDIVAALDAGLRRGARPVSVKAAREALNVASLGWETGARDD